MAMYKLRRPSTSVGEAYSACAQGISNRDKRNAFEACCSEIETAGLEYVRRTTPMSLNSIASCDDSGSKIVGDLTGEMLCKLYTQYMVQEGKPGRKIYDFLLVQANGRCPYCNIGHASTLDHYLPKSAYPLFSVNPDNLVPACKDCNTGKGGGTLEGKESQVLHPYFDDVVFYREKWVSAKVLRTEPVSLEFFVSPPSTWASSAVERVRRHFHDFNIAYRFSVESANELAVLERLRSSYFSNQSAEQFSSYLKSVAQGTGAANHWKTVMYESLSEDRWYLSL